MVDEQQVFEEVAPVHGSHRERDVRCDRTGCRAGPCRGCRTPFHPKKKKKKKKKKNVCVH